MKRFLFKYRMTSIVKQYELHNGGCGTKVGNVSFRVWLSARIMSRRKGGSILPEIFYVQPPRCSQHVGTYWQSSLNNRLPPGETVPDVVYLPHNVFLNLTRDALYGILSMTRSDRRLSLALRRCFLNLNGELRSDYDYKTTSTLSF